MSLVLRIGAVRADYIQSGQDAASSDTDAHDIPVPEEVYRRPTQSYPGCFGLPYQDHNYGMPPPLSPVPPKSPSPPPPKDNGPAEVEEETKVPAVSCEEEVVEDSITRCICGFLHDDGYMICCDKCSVWQHIDCMEIDRNNIPDNYCCEICEPRKLDIERARMIQLRRREEIDTSATDTDPEEPANALASLGKKPVQPKPKGSKQRRVSKTGARLLKTGRLAKSQQLKRDSKLKLTKKEKENVKDALKKQKVGKTTLPKEKKMKKKLNTSQTQNKADFWNISNGTIEETKENEYSPEVLEFLSHAKTNGIHSPHSIGVFPEELLVRLYQVSEVKKNYKGLEATDLIVPGKAVIEFKGKVMLRRQYQQDPLLDWSQPNVLYYSKFEGLDLCIDASAFGGDARFIRRSCTPNAEMCHIIDNGNLQFIVQAKKEIVKGTEITIPFDFNYQDSPSCVECACGKVSCPVVKYWKKMKLAQKSPEKPKRKRQASGEGRVRRNSQGKGSPVKAANGNKSPVKYSPVKTFDTSPLTSVHPIDMPELAPVLVDELPTFPPLVKPNPIPRRSSRASSDVKEERDVKASRVPHSKENCGKAAVPLDHVHMADLHTPSAESSVQPLLSESEADSAGECPRKLTREERKMEAIMKAFEKLEKREERRKEALARQDKKHVDVKEEPMDRSQPPETVTLSVEDPPVVDRLLEQPSHSSASSLNQSPEVETKVVVNLEDSPVIVDSPHKSARHRRVKRKRRNSRVMSAIEPLYSSPVKVQIPVAIEPVQTGIEELKEEPVEQPPSVATHPVFCAPLQDFVHSQSEEETPSYLYHKKKKYLMNEQIGSPSPNGREEEMFVSCAPGPRSSMEHIQRRYSTSATYGRPSDSSIGSAKKRWLRQAMHETEPLTIETITSSPRSASVGSSSPPLYGPVSVAPPTPSTATATTSLHSPTGSPSDFVTPLKKRRLAPEFLPSTSAAHTSPACNGEPTAPAAPSVFAESSASSSNTSTPATADTNRLPTDSTLKISSNEGKRPPLKATCLFGRRARNGFVGSTDNEPSVFVGPVPESSASAVPASAKSSTSQSGQDELSMDGLSSVSSHPAVGYASAGSSATSTVVNLADIAEASEGSSDSPGATASSSSMVCVSARFEPVAEMPLVDSSDAARDSGLPGGSQQGAGGSDSVGVCSSDNEVSTPCVHSADSNQEEHNTLRQDEVVTESSSASSASRSYCFQEEDENVSESQPVVDRMEVEEEGNEATGSVSLCEELSTQAESVSRPVSQPAADCQVNSSQDFPSNNRMAAISCSPGQAEAECNISSFMSHVSHLSSLPAVDRSDDRQVATNESERAGVSSAFDSCEVDRERSGVSSAKDSAAVSSVVSVQDSESLASSDVECGPSSSTQALHSRHEENVENMVCNSSDVTGSNAIPFMCEESNVDSTTQNGRVVHSDPNHCDTADSQLQASESEESCCDSNSDEQAVPAVVVEGAGVSSSGPADSQCDVDRGPGGVSAGNCVVSSSASVSSSVHSRSSTDRTLSMLVSSSLYSSSSFDSAPSRQVSSMLASASTSSLSTTEASELPGPSQSTSAPSHTVSDPSSDIDSPSVGPTSNAAPLMEFDSRESDSVDTSEPSSGSPYPTTEQCEASTSSVHGRRLSVCDDWDPSTRPVSSSLMQGHSEGDLSVSSGNAESDMLGDRVAVNGDQPHGGMVSSYSEDSSGSSTVNHPCTSVSSSEAQAAPIAKRKVSLSEYRNRRKDKSGCAASTSSSASPKSSSDHGSSRRNTLDGVSLAPLPLFEPITIGRENRDTKESEREKPMSLEDRLRIEFGLETTCEEEDKANSSEEEDGQPSPSFMAKSPSAMASATLTSMGGSHPSTNAAAGHGAVQPGYTWLAKLHSGRPASSGVGCSGPSQPHQLPSTSAVFTTGSLQQHSPQTYNAVGAGGSQLPNGSHPPAPATFSTGSVYPPSASQGQPPAPPQSFSAASAKQQQQQQAPPPPPLPSTAYPSYFAQSRTPSLHPQTSPVGAGHHSQPGRSGSVSHAAAVAAPVGNGVSQARHSAANPSSNHSHGRYHYDQFSRSETVKHKGSLGPDRKRR